jgi:putative two-component system response regulator
MASGTNDPDTADEILAVGTCGFLVKPFEHSEVAIDLADALRRRRVEIEYAERGTQLDADVLDAFLARRHDFGAAH